MAFSSYAMVQVMKARQIREGSFGFLIQTLARRIDVTMRRRLREIDVDVKVFANLMALSEQDGINQRQLGERLDFPEYYTSRNVDALVAAGYAERQPDPHSRRSFLVFLTEAGHAKAARLPKIIGEVNEFHLQGLSADERQSLIALLQKTAGIGQAVTSDSQPAPGDDT